MFLEIAMIFGLLACYSFWSTSLRAREIAFNAVAKKCLELDLQLLDQYVAIKKLSFKKDLNGRIVIRRVYSFEFSSTGTERYNGRILLHNYQVYAFQMDPYRIPN